MDMRGADLALLVSLDVLIDEANVTRAAARLHISQPALSAQLARLRALFGDALLVPSDSGRGMTPTARAVQMQPPLRAALAQLNGVLREPEQFVPATAVRTFHVAANDNVIVMLGLGLVGTLQASANRALKLAFRDTRHDTLLAQMERGELDLVLGAATSMPAALKTRPLLNDRFQVAQRKGHPRGRSAPDLDAYCAASHVLVSSNGGLRGVVDEELARRGRQRDVVLSVPQCNLVPAVLSRTDYLCTLPSRFLQRYADTLDSFPLPFDSPAFNIVMAWHPRSDNDPGHRWLRQQWLDEAGPVPDSAAGDAA